MEKAAELKAEYEKALEESKAAENEQVCFVSLVFVSMSDLGLSYLQKWLDVEYVI